MQNYYYIYLPLIDEALDNEYKIDWLLNNRNCKYEKNFALIKKYVVFVRKNLYTLQYYLLENKDFISMSDWLLISELLKLISYIQGLYTKFLFNKIVNLNNKDIEKYMDSINNEIKKLELKNN